MVMEGLTALGLIGGVAAVSMAAVGSALGTGAAGAAAVGAWKRCFVQNKPAPFQLAVFVGAPLSQTIYGMILMLLLNGKAQELVEASANAGSSTYTMGTYWAFLAVAGLLGGTAMGVSAWMQGRAAAGACDAFAETGKGFTNNLLVLGVIETVALFVMVFVIIILPAAPAA